jgi:uncharacterized protein YbjT (DUF2867 family)
MNSTTTLVIGGTGRTGRRVADRLSRRGVPVRIGSRSGSPPFEWEDPSTWAPVLDGAGAAYVAYHPDLAVPGAADTVGALAHLAAEAGVRRLVLLSGRGEPEAQRAEQLVLAAPLEATIVRASWFAQYFSENFLLEEVLAGEIVLPAGDVREPFVDAEDLADVAVAALTGDTHAGEVYEITGPELLSFQDVARTIGRATGRELRYVAVSAEEYAAVLAAQSVDPALAEMLVALFTEVLDGRNASLADGVRRALGREPRAFARYAEDTAATGAWER